ncbi:MAG: PKD domain-containing protein [Flavobacteriales bacterium]|nr:PKD domain-containing protein [Flavobacteriales bacterium]MCB9168087.1 PKD domain-containing protein [Flavobacteriales bacterium]
MTLRHLLFSVLLTARAGGDVLGQVPAVVLADDHDLATSVQRLDRLREQGMHVAVVAGPGAFIGTFPDMQAVEPFERSTGLLVWTGYVPDNYLDQLTKEQHIAVLWLNELLNGDLEGPSASATMDWSAHPEPDREPADGGVSGTYPARGGGSGPVLNWTCGTGQNSERMAGTVAACVFFTESDGTIDPDQYTWTQSAIDDVQLQLIDAWSIWSYTASLYGANVTAVMDWYTPSGGVPVQGYEPIQHPSYDDHLWIEACMAHLGYATSSASSRLNAFHVDRRAALGTDHAYSCFIAYNPPAQGAPNQMTDGKIGYAYLGGPYTQILYKANGWSTGQINRVYGHETGHIFHAFDEYSSSSTSNCGRSFNGAPNQNYHGSTCNGAAACVMVDNSYTGSGATRHWNLCMHTPGHLGWGAGLSEPQLTAPVNDSIISSVPFVLRWSPAILPPGVTGYAQVFDRNTDQRVYCGYVGTSDTLELSLVNGDYAWVLGRGNGSVSSGYAGILSAVGRFSVNAALNADFTFSPDPICAGSSVQFTDASTGLPTSWDWEFQGGGPATYSGQAPPPVVYGAPGNFDVRLVVGDGVTTDTLSLVAAIGVEGGLAIPYEEGFEVGFFPPVDWTNTTYGGGQGGSLAWSADAFASCNLPTVAYVNAHAFSGTFAMPELVSPRIDLTGAHWPYLRFRHAYAQESATVTETLDIIARSCDYQVFENVFQASGADLATNGGGYVSGTAWSPASCADWTTTWVRLDSLIGHVALLDLRLQTTGGQNLYVDDIAVFDGVLVSPRMLLQGAYDGNSGLMRDDLRAQGLIPLNEPYTAAGYVFTCEGGGETTTPDVLTVTGPDAIVDWVVVELRDAVDPTLVVCDRAALLQRDGDVVDVDGTSPVRFAAPEGNYRIVLRHRNHLGVMTAMPVSLGYLTTVVDLSLPATATYGTNARTINGAKALLWAGNTNGNSSLKYTGAANDRDPILVVVGGLIPTNSVNGYLPEDVTMNGVVKYTGAGNDRDPILVNIGGSVPTSFLNEQIP